MRYLININGMTCGNCVKHVEKALRSVPGVLEAKVNLDSKSAQVTKVNGGSLDESVLKNAVEKIGYKVISLKQIN